MTSVTTVEEPPTLGDNVSIPDAQSLILSMNNAAVSSFLKGETDESIAVLRFALANLRDMLEFQVFSSLQTLERAGLSANPQQDQNGCSQHYPALDQSCRACTERQFFTVSFDLHIQKQGLGEYNVVEEAKIGGGFAFFNRVLAISNETFRGGQESLESNSEVARLQRQNRLLVCLLYNMGCYHHFQGIRCCKSSELATALRLYELAFSIVETSYRDFAVGDQALILLALHNQMGHIHSHYFCNATQAQVCVHRLQEIFYHCHVAKQRQHQEICSSLDRDDFIFFFQYMPMSAQQQGSVASAA